MRIELGAATHTGRVRQVNEDSYLALGSIAVVADGMGGHAAGDVASALAIASFRELAREPQVGPDAVRDAVERANRAIAEDVLAHPERDGMGTTVAGIVLVQYAGSPHWMVFNVGDSRVYRIEGATAHQLTVDHSEVAELIATRRITIDEAVTHPLRHVVTRSLGTEPPPSADVWFFPPSDDGETFVLCSDGLTNELGDQEIGALACSARGPRDAAAQLVEAAVDAGGRDNVTVVVVSLRPASPDSVNGVTAPRGAETTA